MSKMPTKEEMRQSFYLESKSKAYLDMLRNCENVADSNVNVMILGESGTGKDVAARYIHACSDRRDRPFVVVNCSAYPDTLLESELFGHEQGAFTGATRAREGRFEQANTGTLFIDEIGDVSLSTQVKLLRAIETKQIERIGANQSQQVEFRLLSATNKDPYTEIRAGRMREDFLYRISTIVIRIPSVRERPEDVEDLVRFFLQRAQGEFRKEITTIVPKAWEFLMHYNYPGNLREMKNIVDRMVVLSEDGVITERGLPVLYDLTLEEEPKPKPRFETILSWKEFKRQSEAEYLRWVLEQTGHNVTEAARRLGISARQLFNKISEYELR